MQLNIAQKCVKRFAATLTAEVQQCACDLDLELENEVRVHRSQNSIVIAAFRLAPPIGGLLVF